jgi:hypothetical protein
VQVPYDEGAAIRIGPESCAVAREDLGEALTGGAHRPAIEPRKFPILGADTELSPNLGDGRGQAAAG